MDITSEMAVLCSSLQPVRTSELEIGGDSGSPPTPLRRNIAAPAVRVPKLPLSSALKATVKRNGEDVVYIAHPADGIEELHPLSIADQAHRLERAIWSHSRP